MFPLNRCSILFSSHRLSLPKRNASKIIPQSEWNPFVFFARSKHNGDISGPSVDKTRLVKRVVAGVLFSTTLGLAIYGKQTRKKRLNEYLEGCQRLPHDPDFTSSVGSEFYRCHECVFPASTVKSGTLKQLEEFIVNKDDVIVSSFPKSGTTWVQEIVYLIVTGLDFLGAQKQVLESRFPYLEYPYPGLASLKKIPHPRMIKTHLPLSLLPPSAAENGAKVIYIARNPKDVVVSYYHFLRMAAFISYKGSWEDFVSKFLKGDVPYGPYFSHVLPYWQTSQDNPDSNILWITYEDMHKDPEGSVRRIAHFLDRPLTDEQVRLIVEHTRFDRMAHNPSVNYSHWDDLGLRNKNESRFMRQGRVGDWQRYFDAETNKRFDDWIQDNLINSSLKFNFLSDETKTDANQRPVLDERKV